MTPEKRKATPEELKLIRDAYWHQVNSGNVEVVNRRAEAKQVREKLRELMRLRLEAGLTLLLPAS